MNLIDFLRSWILNIVTVIIFISFLEILLPNSDMKKYVKMVIGLLVMLVIINPMLELVHGDMNIEEEIFKTSSVLDKKALSLNIDKFEGIQEKQMITLYKEKIEKHIKNQIEYGNNIKVLSVQCEIEKNKSSKKLGNVKHVNILLSNNLDSKTTNKDIEPVSNIMIHINKEQNQANIKENDNENKPIIKQIKEDISNFYAIDMENVCINME